MSIFNADIISFKLPDLVEDKNELATAIILHTSKIDKIFINGDNK